MEENHDTILQHLSEINIKKDKIREGLTLSRQTYAAYIQRQKKAFAIRFSFATAGMAAAVLLGFIFIPSWVRMDPERVFDKNYQRFVFDTHDRGTNPSDRLTTSAQLYSNGQHEKAMQLLDSTDYGSSDKVRTQFIKGLIELDRGNLADAEIVLKEVVDSGGVLGNAAGWYLSILYIKAMHYQEAAKWLKVVRDYKGSPHAKSASKLYHRVRFRATR
jgi:hypothetical protein